MGNRHSVELTLRAQRDLRDIATYHMVKVGANSARKITDKILSSLEQLGSFPEIGAIPRMQLVADAGFRYLVVKDYLCFYTITERTVFVHHIVHGSTDYIKRLF